MARDAALGRSVPELMIPPRHRDAHHAGMRRLAEGGEFPIAMGRASLLEEKAAGSALAADACRIREATSPPRSCPT